MAKGNSQMGQHKRLALGEKVGMACGGMVPGGKLSPLTVARRNNGVPGMKKGGKAKK